MSCLNHFNYRVQTSQSPQVFLEEGVTKNALAEAAFFAKIAAGKINFSENELKTNFRKLLSDYPQLFLDQWFSQLTQYEEFDFCQAFFFKEIALNSNQALQQKIMAMGEKLSGYNAAQRRFLLGANLYLLPLEQLEAFFEKNTQQNLVDQSTLHLWLDFLLNREIPKPLFSKIASFLMSKGNVDLQNYLQPLLVSSGLDFSNEDNWLFRKEVYQIDQNLNYQIFLNNGRDISNTTLQENRGSLMANWFLLARCEVGVAEIFPQILTTIKEMNFYHPLAWQPVADFLTSHGNEKNPYDEEKPQRTYRACLFDTILHKYDSRYTLLLGQLIPPAELSDPETSILEKTSHRSIMLTNDLHGLTGLLLGENALSKNDVSQAKTYYSEAAHLLRENGWESFISTMSPRGQALLTSVLEERLSDLAANAQNYGYNAPETTTVAATLKALYLLQPQKFAQNFRGQLPLMRDNNRYNFFQQILGKAEVSPSVFQEACRKIINTIWEEDRISLADQLKLIAPFNQIITYQNNLPVTEEQKIWHFLGQVDQPLFKIAENEDLVWQSLLFFINRHGQPNQKRVRFLRSLIAQNRYSLKQNNLVALQETETALSYRLKNSASPL